MGPTAKRATRLAAAGRWLARRPKITGVMLERFLGHCTFQLMGERSLLSTFGSCYRFVWVHYKQKVRLWQRAAWECEWLSALVRFARTNLRRPWSSTADMFDSSETGLGIVQGSFDEKLIASTGQYNERWPFKQPHALARGVRAGALWHFRDVIENAETVLPVAPPPPRPWRRRRGFPEVPTKLLEKDSWHTILSKPWFRDEHITLLEARTGRLVCKSLGRSVGNRNKKHLILGDSMGSILAFLKGRSGDYRMLGCCKSVAAYTVALNCKFKWRWVVSEVNHADAPSRMFEPSAPKRARHGRKYVPSSSSTCNHLAHSGELPTVDAPSTDPDASFNEGGLGACADACGTRGQPPAATQTSNRS